MSTLEQITEAYNRFVENNAKFEEGNNAAGTRARAALNDLSKLCKLRRAEISEAKNAPKEE